MEFPVANKMKRSYYVKAIWDDEAKVYYTESDIFGLHIETKTLDEFEDVMHDLAIDMIVANHLNVENLTSTPFRDLIPAIIWHRPQEPTSTKKF
jgi:Domain of unknown function (DUF1902)